MFSLRTNWRHFLILIFLYSTAADAVEVIDASSEHWTLEDRLEIITQYGLSLMAYSALQRDMLYADYRVDNRPAFIAYRIKHGFVLVLGDPIAALEDYEPVIDAFINGPGDGCKKGGASFCVASYATGTVLNRMGHFVNQVGVEASFDLSKLDFVGSKWSDVRNKAKKFDTEGWTLIEMTWSEVMASETRFDQIKRLMKEWLESKSVSEVSLDFLVRRFHFEDEKKVRSFFVINPQQEIKAFYIYEPKFQDGKVTSRHLNHKVHANKENYPNFADTAVFYKLAKHFREGDNKGGFFKNDGSEPEILDELSLGYLPLYGINDAAHGFKHGWITAFVFKSIYNFSVPPPKLPPNASRLQIIRHTILTCISEWICENLFNFSGQAKHKIEQRKSDKITALFMTSPGWFTKRFIAMSAESGILFRHEKDSILKSLHDIGPPHHHDFGIASPPALDQLIDDQVPELIDLPSPRPPPPGIAVICEENFYPESS